MSVLAGSGPSFRCNGARTRVTWPGTVPGPTPARSPSSSAGTPPKVRLTATRMPSPRTLPSLRLEEGHARGHPDLDEAGLGGGDRGAELVAELLAPRHARRRDAVGLRDRGAVELGQVEARRALDPFDRPEPLQDRVLRV